MTAVPRVTLLAAGWLAAGCGGGGVSTAVSTALHTDHLGGIGAAVASLHVGGGVFGGLVVSGRVAYLPAIGGLSAFRVGPPDSSAFSGAGQRPGRRS